MFLWNSIINEKSSEYCQEIPQSHMGGGGGGAEIRPPSC